MSDDGAAITLLPGAACIARPAAEPDLIQVAVRHETLGWIGAALDRRAASRLATDLQAFVDFRSTPDVDA